MKKISRVMMFFLVVLFVLNTSFAGVDSFAAPDGTPVANMTELKAAIDRGDAKIYLTADIPNAGVIKIENKNPITIDLNGYDIELIGSGSSYAAGFIEINHSIVTICDSTINSQDDYSILTKYDAAGKIINGNSRVAGGFGGGICVSGAGSLVLDGGIIFNCNSVCGGGVAVIQGSSFTMKKGCIDFNMASGAGAGVFVGNSTFTMEDGFIRGNQDNSLPNQSIDGGGVYVCDDSTFNMKGGQIGNDDNDRRIAGNSIKGDGGGVYVEESTFNFTKGIITTNVTNDTGKGSGIFLGTDSVFTMTKDCTIKNHSTGPGSAIYVDGADSCNITGGNILDNKSGNFKGAIYVSGNTTNSVNISSVSMTGNNKAIYIEKGASVTLENVDISNNKCPGGDVAGIYDDGNLKLIGDNNIYNNLDDNNIQSNIYLTEGTLIEVSDNLTDKTKIGVWSDAKKPVKVTKDYGNKANANWQIHY